MNDIRVVQVIIALVAIAGWFASRVYDFSFAWIAIPCAVASIFFMLMWFVRSNEIL